jgi:hypothetical protein
MFPVDFMNSGFKISSIFPCFEYQKIPIYFLISEFVIFSIDFLNSGFKKFPIYFLISVFTMLPMDYLISALTELQIDSSAFTL